MPATVRLRAQEGFDQWTHMVGELVMPVSLTTPYADDRFRATVTSVPLGDTGLSGFSFSPMSARRAAAHIRRGDPERYFLFLVHGTAVGIDQCRNTALLTAGTMGLFDTSHPLACEFFDEGEDRLSRVSLIPLRRDLLPVPRDRADALLGTALPAGTVSGTLLASYVSGLRALAGRADAAELHRLGAATLALASAYLATATDSTAPLPEETRREVLVARIRAFIDARLSDPGLDPATVAAHHHISVRLLHRLFEDQPETVAAHIRRLRLERVRADLADPRLARHTVAALAARRGYRHPADFNRAFRRAYGMPPGEYRRLAGRPRTTEGGPGATPDPPPPVTGT
ncbi:helix-turn-helix domain-containing protein [Streptomyces filamentosus]|uniref:helix-turn-helix domain-containing protein n=1 Tax=Streptomyces filamentosus TaxID=67294 RepID=UPI0036E5810B